MAWWQWSKTAASNGTADSTINFAEGMAPSAVNDSARALMARAAEWRDDVSGTITTGGSATAFTVTSNQVFDTLAHMHGAMIAFVPHATNTNTAGNSATLAVDGLTAKPIRFSPSVEVPSGTLVLGTPYVVTYNNTDGAFYLRNLAGHPYGIPLGGLLPYTGTTAPNTAFVLPFGQAISRTTYATYFALVGTTYGTGDGSTTFNIPDLRGRSVFGLDNMGGSAASRITTAGGNFDGTLRGATGGAENQTLDITQIPSHNHGGGSHTHTTPSIGNGGTFQDSNHFELGATDGTVTSPIQTSSSGTIITSQGGGLSHPIMPPAIVLPYILRVI